MGEKKIKREKRSRTKPKRNGERPLKGKKLEEYLKSEEQNSPTRL